MKEVIKASRIILDNTKFKGDIAIILGSGLGGFTDALENKKIIKYTEIPYYPLSTIPGHAGELVIGKINDKELIVANGRFHYYEGYSKEQVTFPIKILHKCGIKNLIITNSSGSLKESSPPGTIVAIKGHMDFSFQKKIQDPVLNNDIKFHSSKLIALANVVAVENRISFTKGNYCWTLGPMYETPEEINYLKSLNGSVVGMSTLPEIKEAGLLGLNVLTLSVITNFAAGISKTSLSHEEVLFNAKKAKHKMIKLLSGIIDKIT